MKTDLFTAVYLFDLPNGPIPLAVTFELDTSDLMLLLDEMQRRTHDPSVLLNNLAGIIRNSFRRNFEQGGRPAWIPLKPSTIARKSAAGLPARTKKGNIPKRLMQQGVFGPQNILIARGDLRDSYVQKSARGHVEDVNSDQGTVEVGSNLRTQDGKPLAIFHQYGTRSYVIHNAFGRKGLTVNHPGLPARPQTITDQEADEMAVSTAKYLMGEQLT